MTFHSFTRLRHAAVAAALLGNASLSFSAQALLSVTPQASSGGASSISVDITATVLTPGTALGAYDFVLSYDAALWAPQAATFSSFLGNVDNFEVITDSDFSTPGAVRLINVSLVGPFDPLPLSDIQPATGTPFLLASVAFAAVGSGSGSFALRDVQLSDAMGASITAVPEPGTWALMALGLGAIAACRSRSRRRLAGQPG